MNDFSSINTYSDKAILKQIGEFVRQKRIEKNLTQHDLAQKAAMSRSTLSLMERGENIVLGNLIKALRILDALHVFDSFRTETVVSPILLAKEEQKKRKRASRGKDDATEYDDLGW